MDYNVRQKFRKKVFSSLNANVVYHAKEHLQSYCVIRRKKMRSKYKKKEYNV